MEFGSSTCHFGGNQAVFIASFSICKSYPSLMFKTHFHFTTYFLVFGLDLTSDFYATQQNCSKMYLQLLCRAYATLSNDDKNYI
jgi:hypothetical protein